MKKRLDERGVASAIGFLLVLMAAIALATAVFAGWGRTAQIRATGLIDAMRDAEGRQNQLLTFTYVRENATADNLTAYIFNYGTREATADKIWLNGTEVTTSDYPTFDNNFPPKKLVSLTIENLSAYVPSTADNYSLVIHTESNALYSWLIGRQSG